MKIHNNTGCVVCVMLFDSGGVFETVVLGERERTEVDVGGRRYVGARADSAAEEFYMKGVIPTDAMVCITQLGRVLSVCLCWDPYFEHTDVTDFMTKSVANGMRRLVDLNDGDLSRIEDKQLFKLFMCYYGNQVVEACMATEKQLRRAWDQMELGV